MFTKDNKKFIFWAKCFHGSMRMILVWIVIVCNGLNVMGSGQFFFGKTGLGPFETKLTISKLCTKCLWIKFVRFFCALNDRMWIGRHFKTNRVNVCFFPFWHTFANPESNKWMKHEQWTLLFPKINFFRSQ